MMVTVDEPQDRSSPDKPGGRSLGEPTPERGIPTIESLLKVPVRPDRGKAADSAAIEWDYLVAKRRFSSSIGRSEERPRIFLCHSSGDKDRVRELYRRLSLDGIGCWFDEEDLLPGQEWEYEINKAIPSSQYVLACLSRASITKAGYVQKELKKALDVADEQPEGSIFLIPVRLEECEVPDRLRRWNWVDLFKEGGYERLLRVLKADQNSGN